LDDCYIKRDITPKEIDLSEVYYDGWPDTKGVMTYNIDESVLSSLRDMGVDGLLKKLKEKPMEISLGYFDKRLFLQVYGERSIHAARFLYESEVGCISFDLCIMNDDFSMGINEMPLRLSEAPVVSHEKYESSWD
jgi:hypothetical protein